MEAKYQAYYEKLKISIESTCPEVLIVENVNSESISQFLCTNYSKNFSIKNTFPRLGSFEVYFRGQLIYSKLCEGKWPNPLQVANKIRNVIDGINVMKRSETQQHISPQRAVTANPAMHRSAKALNPKKSDIDSKSKFLNSEVNFHNSSQKAEISVKNEEFPMKKRESVNNEEFSTKKGEFSVNYEEFPRKKDEFSVNSQEVPRKKEQFSVNSEEIPTKEELSLKKEEFYVKKEDLTKKQENPVDISINQPEKEEKNNEIIEKMNKESRESEELLKKIQNNLKDEESKFNDLITNKTEILNLNSEEKKETTDPTQFIKSDEKANESSIHDKKSDDKSLQAEKIIQNFEPTQSFSLSLQRGVETLKKIPIFNESEVEKIYSLVASDENAIKLVVGEITIPPNSKGLIKFTCSANNTNNLVYILVKNGETVEACFQLNLEYT